MTYTRGRKLNEIKQLKKQQKKNRFFVDVEEKIDQKIGFVLEIVF